MQAVLIKPSLCVLIDTTVPAQRHHNACFRISCNHLVKDVREIFLSCHLCSLNLIYEEKIDFGKVTGIDLGIIWRWVQHDPHLPFRCCLNDIIHQINLILQKHNVVLPKIRQHFIDIIF